MRLKDIYIKMCYNYEFLENYSESGQGKNGRIFVFQNTNYRLLLSFIKNYAVY